MFNGQADRNPPERSIGMSSRQVTWDDFAAYLRAIRASRNLSQRDLGAQLGCGQIHVWRLEHGQRHPSRALLLLLKRDFLLLISAQGTKAVVDWQHGSTTEGRLARGAA